MEDLLNAPISKLGISEVEATKLSEALNIQTVRDLATNQHFLLAQNYHLLAGIKATASKSISERKHPFLELVSSITGATVLFAALLYTAGWSYLYQYYKAFGIRVSELNVAIYDSLVYSLPVIFSDFWSIFWLLTAIILVGSLFSINRINENLATPLGMVLFLVVILALGFWLSHKGATLGAAQAQKDMRETGGNLPGVRLKMAAETMTGRREINPKKEKTADEATGNQTTEEEEFDQAGFKLLVHANERYYLFRPIKESPSLPASNLDLYVVPDSRVRSVYIQRGIN